MRNTTDTGCPILRDRQSALRSGDSWHLARAGHPRARGMATLNGVLARPAPRLKIKDIDFA
jgi:hypothetical protein